MKAIISADSLLLVFRYLNGVVSYGASDCGVGQGAPSVYARVKYYLPWIQSKMASA